MYGIQQSFHHVGGGGGQAQLPPQPQPQQIPLNFNAFPNPYLLQQNPNFLSHFHPFLPNYTGFPQIQHYFPNNTHFPVQKTHSSGHGNHQHRPPPPPPQQQQQQPHGDVQKEDMVEKLDKAVERVRKDLLASNENVSAWVVSVAALGMVKAESWESLGFQMQHVPSLNRLLATEGKINAFIHCFVAARRISSLYDLEMAICENEGVERFEELELGPFVRHPLAIHYYSVTSDLTEVYRIRTEDIIFYLCELIDNHKKKEITIDAFLDFIAMKLSVSVKEKLCISIKNLGICIQHIHKAKQSEHRELGKCNEKLGTSEMKSGTKSETNFERKCEPKSDKGSVKRPLVSVQEKELDNNFTEISEGMKPFSSANTQFCGKHVRFIWSSSDDDDTSEAGEHDNDQNEDNTDINSIPLPSVGFDHVSSCPYPSATEERKRLGLINEAYSSPRMHSGGVRCNTGNMPRRKKRKYEHRSPSTTLAVKQSKKDKLNVDIKNRSPDHRGIINRSVSAESLRMCATTGKEAYQVTNADEVVSREAIYYGTADNNFIYSLLNWVLLYAQRYIYSADPDKYLELKDSSFHSIRNLKIFVVEKLYYRSVIKKHKITSLKRHKCNCLLQDNILYCKQESDPHSLFLELSCLFYNGKPQFHFVNFLHTIRTMAESGKTEKQTENFILNSQKMPQLPSDESRWSLRNIPSLGENRASSLEVQISEQSSSHKRKSSTISNSQPADWRTEPGFTSVSSQELKKLRANNGGGSREHDLERTDPSPKDINKEVNIEVDLGEMTSGAVLLDAGLSGSKLNVSNFISTSSTGLVLESVDLVRSDSRIPLSSNHDRDQVMAQQAIFTGRLGELVAFKYFSGKENQTFVKWVNETNETGLPYDIVLGDDEESREYVEVKSTISPRKNWFQISMREWQFAVENGGAFSIAHIVLTENNMAKVTIYKNPARLLQLGNLKLAMVVPKQ